MRQPFRDIDNLVISALDAPDLSDVNSMEAMFYSVESFNSDIGHWDVSSVTDMSTMFSSASRFNRNLTRWDVSNVDQYHDFSTDSRLWDIFLPDFN